ncbi:hypothetical protein HRbin22_01113 [Candidatus Thermoflexus japonica]|uniref:Uncharacterized protein n=1 Tax=Candidatus Thermoflexus japonica TaxID=2035417 RepID=A0A2H5Y5Z9_9CHLR|nr:hypothetical protein HRbin22_01113 [Candidatus Thermoflexus japonica]
MLKGLTGRPGLPEQRGGDGLNILRPERHGFAQRPEGTTVRILGSDLLKPSSVIAHEVAEPPALGVPGVDQKRQICFHQREKGGIPAPHPFPHDHQQPAGVVVGAVAEAAIRDDALRVLEEARVVGELAQVLQAYGRQLRGTEGEPGRAMDRPGAFQHPPEQVQVAVADDRPRHLPSPFIRGPAQPLPLLRVGEQVIQRPGHRFRILERNQDAPPIPQDFLRIP